MSTTTELIDRVDMLPDRMTYEEWHAWAGDRQVLTEWVDGEVIVRVPNEPHQDTLLFLATILRLFVELRDLGKVLIAPFEMRLEIVNASREPDILFVANRNLSRLTQAKLEGPADCVFELASDSTARYDRQVKLVEYARAGILECWLVDPRPRQRRVEPFVLGHDGAYMAMTPDENERYHSTVIEGFWFDTRWLETDNLPSPVVALMQIAGEDFFAHIQDLRQHP